MTTEVLEKPLTGPEARGDFIKEAAPETSEPEALEEALVEEAVVEPEAVDEEATVVEEEPKARDDKGRFAQKGIPKERFDEAVGKERQARAAAEQRVALLEAQLAERAAQVTSAQIEETEQHISELEAQYAALLLDNEGVKAAEVMKQIRLAERAIATAEAERTSRTTTAQILENERLDLAIALLEADNPVLNPESEQFNEGLTNFILSEQRRLITQQGLKPSTALTAAAKSILEQFGPKAAPEPAVEPQGLAKATTPDRKAQAVAKALSVQKAQPAALRDVGLDSDKAGQKGSLPNVSRMTDEEFASLPAATRSRLRGDMLS
jgi:bacterioferritin (cytochrome b1)